MAQSTQIGLGLDVSDFIKGSDKAILSINKMATTGKRAGDDMSRAFKKAGADAQTHLGKVDFGGGLKAALSGDFKNAFKSFGGQAGVSFWEAFFGISVINRVQTWLKNPLKGLAGGIESLSLTLNKGIERSLIGEGGSKPGWLGVLHNNLSMRTLGGSKWAGLANSALTGAEGSILEAGTSLSSLTLRVGSALSSNIAIFAGGVALFAFAAKQFYDIGKYAYEVFKDFNRANKIFEATVRNLGGNINSSALKSQALALSVNAGIGRADTFGAQAFLLKSGFSDVQTQALINIAANIAKEQGKDLGQVTEALADAFNGSMKKLENFGIYAESAAEAQKKLYQFYGGSPKTSDPLKKIEESWNRIYATIGEGIAPSVDAFLEKINDWLNSVSKEQLRDLGETLGTILDAVSAIASVIKKVVDVVWAILNPIVQTAKVIGAALGSILGGSTAGFEQAVEAALQSINNSTMAAISSTPSAPVLSNQTPQTELVSAAQKRKEQEDAAQKSQNDGKKYYADQAPVKIVNTTRIYSRQQRFNVRDTVAY